MVKRRGQTGSAGHSIGCSARIDAGHHWPHGKRQDYAYEGWPPYLRPASGESADRGCGYSEAYIKSLREGIAYVPQDGFLFSSTIRENIAFYKRDTEPAVVEEAARKHGSTTTLWSFRISSRPALGARHYAVRRTAARPALHGE